MATEKGTLTAAFGTWIAVSPAILYLSSVRWLKKALRFEQKSPFTPNLLIKETSCSLEQS